MAWMDNDGRYLKYGPEKTLPTPGGDFSMPGATRDLEFTVNLAGLTTTPTIIGDVVRVDSGVFIEAVEIDVEVAAVGGTSFSFGLIGNDRTTVASNTGFVNGVLTAALTQGAKIVLVGGSTGAGGYVGTTTPSTGYATATAAGTYTAGRVKVRIRYRGYGTITQ